LTAAIPGTTVKRMAQTPLTLHRWRRVEYERLVETGVFDDQPIELIGGHLIVAEPKGAYHSTAVGNTDDALRSVLPSGWIVRNQDPIALDDDSEPEPDIAVVRGSRPDYREDHPDRVALVIEVAESSLAFDRSQKASLYARGGVEDYWIVNVVDGVLEVYRDPAPDPTAPYGWRYRSIETYARTAVVTPLTLPGVRVAVAALLP
jgi:Uma2 family endonuclease